MPRTFIEEHLAGFNRDRDEWRLSLSAQNIIREVFFSLGTDEIGLKGLYESKDRDAARKQAITNLPGFLKRLADAAAEIPKEKRSGDEKVIGAIYVTQHIGWWAIPCGCWQED